jgi:hypothetical protein
MTTDTVERQKIQYAQELAAYTLRQWRDTLERKGDPDPASANDPVPHTQISHSHASRQTRDSRHSMCSPSEPSLDVFSQSIDICFRRTVRPLPNPSLSICFWVT